MWDANPEQGNLPTSSHRFVAVSYKHFREVFEAIKIVLHVVSTARPHKLASHADREDVARDPEPQIHGWW